ncbi:helicase C-terminal domain-containing protein [Nonomuraea sp. NPDC048826]|uniref:helicase C-terminal domain-containing protein n=1 Tax=Nonomuraea sp. NPDC048826 TaxID=3364347 RepID=UPI00371407C0
MSIFNPEFTPTRAHQEAMADYLASAVVEDATGVSGGDTCVGEPPSARYYLASLAPTDLNLSVNVVRMGRATPSSLGFEFEITGDAAELLVSASASCYYRRMPTYTEQINYLADRLGTADSYRLAPVFQKVDVEVGPLPVAVGTGTPTVVVTGQQQFASEFARVRGTAEADRRVERRHGDDRRERSVPSDALTSEEAFETWVEQTNAGDAVLPSFEAHIHLTSRPVEGRIRVAVNLENKSTDPTVVVQGRGRSAGQERHDESRDHFLFRARLAVRAQAGVVLPIRMNLGPDAYRYDRDLPGYASNCGVEKLTDSEDRLVGLCSVPAPVHQTSRAFARQHAATEYAILESDPLPVLRELAEDLAAYHDDPAWSIDGLEPDLASRKAQDREAFSHEIARFADGLQWLERDPRLLLAFKLTNKTMYRLGQKSERLHSGWRLFQLVFLVSQLSALAWREHDPDEFTKGLWGDPNSGDPTQAVSVLWYPTGGGKTEAYLGLTVCCLFYDRARGKISGISAWCRFPLRLLSLQQTQRQLDVVAMADLVRAEAADELRQVGGAPGAPFRIGFYAGGSNTPNSLNEAGLVDRLRRDETARNRYRLVDRCPYCRQRSIVVPPPDPDALQLQHRCQHPECGKTLPLYVTDREIYRYLPAVLVGTLDKLAAIGLSDRFGSLLGDVDCKCKLHGYGRGGKCHERASHHPKVPLTELDRPLHDPSPTLEIVDELHMVNEELGVFSGHYEGLLAAVQQTLSASTRPDRRGVRMKVIATSATIRGEDRQCEHLFGLRSVVVPLPGPSLHESFYWQVDPEAPLRRFVGVLPTRTTAEMTVVRILTAAHTAIRRLQERVLVPESLATLPAADLDALVDLYRTSLTYVTSLVDFGKIRRSMDTQVNEYLRQDGWEEVKVAELKGETPFDQVGETLKDLSTPGGHNEAVVATSMVSHGVDVDRLNLMVFNGMPRAMAEYIQASSRVGRAHLGIIFMIFNAVRERDRSHFRYHGKFHEYLDRMVEPVAINRWSRFAVRRTLPGVLMGYLLQVANRAFWDAGGAPAHLHELGRVKAALRVPSAGGLPAVQLQALLDSLYQAYLGDRDEAHELINDLDERVRRAVDTLRAAGAAAGAVGGSRAYRATADNLGMEHQSMTSLRDVAEGIPFITLPDRRS